MMPFDRVRFRDWSRMIDRRDTERLRARRAANAEFDRSFVRLAEDMMLHGSAYYRVPYDGPFRMERIDPREVYLTPDPPPS